MRLVAMLLAIAPAAWGAELKPATVEAFERYIRETEKRLDARPNFLWADESEDRVRQARQGRVVVQPFGAKAITPVKDGLVHDWVGTIFLQGVSLERTLAQVQDYNRHKDQYKPEVVDSKILS